MANNKDKLRTLMPQTAIVIDQYREIFGAKTKVIWAKEGDREVGKMPKLSSVTIAYDPPSPSDLRKKTKKR